MEWLFPSVVATLAGSLILVFIYSFLYLQDREHHIAIWAWGWKFNSLRFVFMLWSLAAPDMLILTIANQICALVSGVVLLWGTFKFLEMAFNRWWWYVTTLGIGWIIVASLLSLPFLVLTIPTFTFLGVVYIWMGLILLHTQNLSKGSRQITGWAFIIWGIHKTDFPFLRPVLWFAPWGYLLGAVLEFVVALGTLLLYFQKAREKWQLSEAHWRSLTEDSPDHIVTIGKDLSIEFANYASPGLTVENLIGTPLYSYVNGDRQAEIKTFYEQVLATGMPANLETQYLTPDGDTIHYESRVVPRQFQDEIIGLTISARDVTERKQAEEDLQHYQQHLENLVKARTSELKASEEKLRSTLKSLDDLVFVIDSEGIFLDFYQPARVTSLYAPPDQFLGRSYRESLPVEVADQLAEAMDNIARDHSVQQFDYSMLLGDALCWFNAKVSVYRDTTGAAAGVTVVAREITVRKQMEKQLEAANRELEALSALKDQFVSNVSHELRSPIANLKVREYLLERKPDQLTEHLAVMRRETNRLERTIEDLLQLSRLDQQQVTLSLDPVDLNQLVAQFVFDREILAREQGIELCFRAAKELRTVLIDEGLLTQVLSIMVTNAIGYTPSGGLIIVNTQMTCFEDRSWVGFSVKDTGLGIALAEQPRLFERFFRGEIARRSGKKGTGLGLAIAKEIIDRHQGRIEVESTGIPGEGTTFKVWLPTGKVPGD